MHLYFRNQKSKEKKISHDGSGGGQLPMRLHPTAGSRGCGPRAAPHGRLRGDGPRTAPHGRLPASFCALRGHSVEGLPAQTRTKNKISFQEQEEEAARESCRRCSDRVEEPMQELTERSMGLTGSIDVRSGFLQPRAPAAVRPSRSTTAAVVAAAAGSCCRAALALHHGGAGLLP